MKKLLSMPSMKKTILVLLMVSVMILPFSGCGKDTEDDEIGMAVEFMDHAASAFIAEDKGWYKDEGLNLTSYESFATGMALAAALARGDIQVAYLCLIPAINIYANAGVPIKIVAGTHKYGYGLIVNPDKIKSVKDLENEGIRIGCVKEGGAVDTILHKTIDVYDLDSEKVITNVMRMSPQKMAMAVKTGQIDAAFLPEHWATLGESFGFKMLVQSQDVWPDMQGSVLVVKGDLLDKRPDIVEKLVRVNEKATNWINDEPKDSVETLTRQLNSIGESITDTMSGLEITPVVLLRSMNRLDFTTDINIETVQEAIDYAAEIGYIARSFNAEEILDLRFID